MGEKDAEKVKPEKKPKPPKPTPGPGAERPRIRHVVSRVCVPQRYGIPFNGGLWAHDIDTTTGECIADLVSKFGSTAFGIESLCITPLHEAISGTTLHIKVIVTMIGAERK